MDKRCIVDALSRVRNGLDILGGLGCVTQGQSKFEQNEESFD
jgi:hypothetical protein